MLVVSIHTSKMPEDFSTFSDYCCMGIFQIGMLAVPIFLAISGYFLVNKNLSSKNEILIFWKKQIPKVYIPMLI